MKRAFASIAVAFLSVVSLAQSALAGSSGTVSSKGPFAEADVASIDSKGIYREIYVFASTSTDHQPGGPSAGSPFAFAVYVVVDTNTNTLIDEGIGTIDATFSVAKKLGSASISASGTILSLFDNSPHTVTVDLSLTADAPAETASEIVHITVGTAKIVQKFNETFVDSSNATTGDASLDDVDFGNFTTFFSDFGVSKSSMLTVSH
jgi:hypothetical protein